MKGASGRQRADINAIKNIKIYSPNIETQKKITHVLSNLDNLIDINHKRIEILEKSVSSVYQEWFIINSSSKNLKKKQKIKIGSFLKKIPSQKKIKKNAYLKVGKIPIIDQSKKFIAGYTNEIKSLYEKNLPLIVFGDHTRIIKYIDFPFARGADGTQIICSNNEKIHNIFLYYLLLNTNISNEHYSRHYKFLKMKEVYLPNDEQINNFVEFAKPIRTQISILQKKNEHLTNLKYLLLPKLISGEIDISDIIKFKNYKNQ